MKILTKSLLSAGAAAAALVSVAAPAQARHGDGDRIDAGEVIAGALIIGGLAAVLSGGDRDRDRGYDDRGYNDRDGRYDNRGYDNGGYGYEDRGYHGRGRGHHGRGRGYDDDRSGYGYDNGGGSRAAVNQCVSGVERWASRYSRAEVTEIRNIDRTQYGYRVTGKLVVQDGYGGRGGYDRGYDRGYDKGRFTCYVERGRVIDIDYSGLDQWR
jgi:hypothetical protein